MILLCPLIHPPNRCRSQWLYTNAFFPSILWINVRLVSSGNERHSKGEMRVWALLCLSLEELCWRACVRACAMLSVLLCGWVGGLGGMGWDGGGGLERACVCLCLFQAVVSYSLPPLVVMACLWDTDIKLSDWSLSAFEVSWAVLPDLSTRGGSAQYGCCLKISHLLCFVTEATKLTSSY